MAPVTKSTDQAAMKVEQKAKITLYWLEKSRAQRVLWLLEELKLDYELKTYKRQNMQAPEELKKVHPLGKSPLLSIESAATEKPIILAESGVIIEYLIDHFGPHLVPKRYEDGRDNQVGGETESWLRYRQLYAAHGHRAIDEMYVKAKNVKARKRNGQLLTINQSVLRERSPFFIKPVTNMIVGGFESAFLRPELGRLLDFLESQIASSPNGGGYLCGHELTGADIIMSFPLNAARGRAGLSEERHPKLWAYIERLEAVDSFKRSVQKIIDTTGSYDPTL
ncbi:MAG: hypothetical protein Q9191_006760 [Dirinaria sp. TL-2023a]